MKSLNNILSAGIIFLAIVFIPVKSFSQEWSSVQKEVWKTVESHWKALAEENQDKFLNNFHPNFKGFVNWRTMPLDKENLGKWIEHMNKNTDIIYSRQVFGRS